MTLSEMVTLFRVYAEEPDNSSYLDEDIKLLLNKAYLSVVNQLDEQAYFYKIVTETKALASTISLTEAYRKIVRIIDLDTGHQYYLIDVRNWPQADQREYCYLLNKIITLFQDPINSNTYTIFYVPEITDLETDGADQIPDGYHDLIVLKAMIRLGSLEKTKSDHWKSEYAEDMIQLLNSKVEVTGAIYVTQTEDM